MATAATPPLPPPPQNEGMACGHPSFSSQLGSMVPVKKDRRGVPSSQLARQSLPFAKLGLKAEKKQRVRECFFMYYEECATRRLMAERRHQNQVAKKERLFQETLSNVMDGLKGKSEIICAVNSTIEEDDSKCRHRRETLFNQWQSNVFDTIQGQISTKLSAYKDKDVNARRRILLDEYLTVRNRKAGLFRDTVIESDYDPLKSRLQYIRYDQTRLDDPTKRDWAKQKAELAFHGLDRQDYAPRNKDMLSLLLWDKLESTPYGHDAHFYDEMGNMVRPPKHLLRPRVGRRIILDDYNILRGKEVTIAEFPKTRRMVGRLETDRDISPIA